MASKKTATIVAKDDNPDKFDRRVLTIAEWAARTGFSVATARRIINCGDGPKIIDISPRRRGIRVCDDFAWQQARLRQTTARA